MIGNPLMRERKISWKDFSYTRLYVTIQGIIGALTAIVHGTYAILQGNTPTGGFLVAKIGAFTIIQNYLFTGIAAIFVSLLLMIWTVGFIQKTNGSTIFLLIFILLFLVGGGIGQVVFFLIAWGVATQINIPLTFWKKILSENKKRVLTRWWLPFLITGYLFLGAGIAIWLILTPPGTPFQGSESAYLICWSALIIGLFFQVLSIISGFAGDINQQDLISQ
jgi:hypothetical protein